MKAYLSRQKNDKTTMKKPDLQRFDIEKKTDIKNFGKDFEPPITLSENAVF